MPSIAVSPEENAMPTRLLAMKRKNQCRGRTTSLERTSAHATTVGRICHEWLTEKAELSKSLGDRVIFNFLNASSNAHEVDTRTAPDDVWRTLRVVLDELTPVKLVARAGIAAAPTVFATVVHATADEKNLSFPMS